MSKELMLKFLESIDGPTTDTQKLIEKLRKEIEDENNGEG